MYQIHPNARTTPAVRALIASSAEPTGVLAKRYGVSTETIRKWRKRGAEDVQDHSSRPQTLRWRATEEERAIVCELRRSTGFPLDDLDFTVRHFLLHLNRDSIYRILKAERLNRLPRRSSAPDKPIKTFKEYDLGFIHAGIKHLPKRRPPKATGASATYMSPSTARRAWSAWPSRTRRTGPAPVPFPGRPSRLFLSPSPTC